MEYGNINRAIGLLCSEGEFIFAFKCFFRCDAVK